MPWQREVRSRGRPNFVFFLFFGARKRIFFIFRRFIFRPKKTSAFHFFSFFCIKVAAKKKQKRKSILWLSQCTAGRTLSHLQSHTAAVYIATRSAWVLLGSKHWAVSRLNLLSLLLQSVCVNSLSLHAQSYAFITPYWTAMVSVPARPHALFHVSNNHCYTTLSFCSCVTQFSVTTTTVNLSR